MFHNWGKTNLKGGNLTRLSHITRGGSKQRLFREALPKRQGFTVGKQNAGTKSTGDTTVTTTYTDQSNNNVDETKHQTQLKLPNMLASFDGYVLSIMFK